MIVHDWWLINDLLDRAGTAHGNGFNIPFENNSILYGSSIHFPSSGCELNVGYLNIFQYTNFSISFWAKGPAEGGGVERSIWVESNSTTGTPFFQIHKLASYWRYYIRTVAGTVLIDYYDGISYFDDTWKFFVVSDANGEVKGWVNGSQALTGSYIRAAIGGNENTIGYSHRTGSSKWFNGYIQHMRIYDEALTQQQAVSIRQTYTESFTPTW